MKTCVQHIEIRNVDMISVSYFVHLPCITLLNYKLSFTEWRKMAKELPISNVNPLGWQWLRGHFEKGHFLIFLIYLQSEGPIC